MKRQAKTKIGIQTLLESPREELKLPQLKNKVKSYVELIQDSPRTHKPQVVYKGSKTSRNRKENSNLQIPNSSHPGIKSPKRFTPRLSNMALQPFLNYQLKIPEQKIAPCKISTKKSGLIQAYAANTHRGTQSASNQDRVTIQVNKFLPHKNNPEELIRSSFFGLYDGHNGSFCSRYLRKNFFKILSKHPKFNVNPILALSQSFRNIDQKFLTKAKSEVENSGSSVVVALFFDNICLIANTGNARAILSSNQGKQLNSLSKDHVPDSLEKQRVIKAGGYVVRDSSQDGLEKLKVFPGKLSVTRSVGDLFAKVPGFGGLPNLILNTPDIKDFRIQDKHDFIIIVSDGVLEVLENKELVSTVWKQAEQNKGDMVGTLRQSINMIIEEAMRREAKGNLTVIVIALKGLKEKVYGKLESVKRLV